MYNSLFLETAGQARTFHCSVNYKTGRQIHVFPYSERKGTKAMEMPNHIDQAEKKRRARELLLVSKDLEIAYAK